MAALFPVCALVMITIGVIFGILGNVKQDFKTLLAAVVFILSGKLHSFNQFLNRLTPMFNDFLPRQLTQVQSSNFLMSCSNLGDIVVFKEFRELYI